MIRPFTCLCMLLAAGAGLYLYQEKHRAQVLDREIMRVVKATDVARDRTRMLRAEWALLNEPDRLASLAERHLALKPLTPGQFVPIADLANRLPPPILPGTPQVAMDDAAPLEPASLDPASPDTAKTLVAQEPAPLPLPAPPPPAFVSPPAAAPLAAAPVRAATVKPASPAATVQISAPARPPHPVRAKPSELGETFAVMLPPPKPVYTPVMRVVATSALANPGSPAVHAPTMQKVDAVVARSTAESSPPLGSSLGMARTMLPPPLPVAVASTPGAAQGR